MTNDTATAGGIARHDEQYCDCDEPAYTTILVRADLGMGRNELQERQSCKRCGGLV